MKKTFNEYQKIIARLYAACEINDDYPESPVLVDINKVSDILEDEFLKVGHLKAEEDKHGIRGR